MAVCFCHLSCFIICQRVADGASGSHSSIYCFIRLYCNLVLLSDLVRPYAGQTAAILVFGSALFFRNLEDKHYFWAGLGTVFCMVKVQYLPFVAIVGILLGKTRFVTGLSIAALTVILLAGMRVGWKNIAAWPLALLAGDNGTFLTNRPELMDNARGILFGCVPAQLLSIVVIVIAGAGSLGLGFIWLSVYPRLKTIDSRAFKGCAAVSILVMICIAPHVYCHDYSAVSLACFLIWYWLDSPEHLPSVNALITRFLIASFPDSQLEFLYSCWCADDASQLLLDLALNLLDWTANYRMPQGKHRHAVTFL